jgi:hypothetical protein
VNIFIERPRFVFCCAVLHPRCAEQSLCEFLCFRLVSTWSVLCCVRAALNECDSKMPKTRRQQQVAEEVGNTSLINVLAFMSETLVALKLRIDTLQSPVTARTQDAGSAASRRASATASAIVSPAQLPTATLRRFRGNGALHPMEFLKQIEKNTLPYNAPDETMIDIAINHLDGAAQDWANALSDQWDVGRFQGSVFIHVLVTGSTRRYCCGIRKLRIRQRNTPLNGAIPDTLDGKSEVSHTSDGTSTILAAVYALIASEYVQHSNCK